MSDKWNAMIYRLDRTMMRKTLKIVDSFIQEKNGTYEIIHDVDGKVEIVFSSQSKKEAFKKWEYYQRMKWIQSEPPYNKWDRRFDCVVNRKKLRVYSCVGKESADDFFGKEGTYFCKRLLELEEWWNNYLRERRDRDWNARQQRISESNEKYKQKLKEEQEQKEKKKEYHFLDFLWDNFDANMSRIFGGDKEEK